MATVEPQVSTLSPDSEGVALSPVVAGPIGWKRRLEDPFNTYYRYPLALALTRWLVKTPVTPNQVSLVQPIFAAAAGYLLTFNSFKFHLAAAACFEMRSILDCVDGSLARAKRMSSPNGHAIDAMADWLGVVFLYAGIFHYVFHNVPTGFSRGAAMVVLGFALAQASLRSFASDYFKQKYMAIYERAVDDVPEILRNKVLGLGKASSIFAHIEVFIMRTGHLFFEFEWFDPSRSRSLPSQAVEKMVREQESKRVRALGALWSISSGDAFLSFVILTIVLDCLWAGQLFFATAGWAWIVAVILANVVFLRRYRGACQRSS
jgi:phosphatidylglycerophosphate synthase